MAVEIIEELDVDQSIKWIKDCKEMKSFVGIKDEIQKFQLAFFRLKMDWLGKPEQVEKYFDLRSDFIGMLQKHLKGEK